MEIVCMSIFVAFHIAVIVLRITKAKEYLFNYSNVPFYIFFVLPMVLYFLSVLYLFNTTSVRNTEMLLDVSKKVAVVLSIPFLAVFLSKGAKGKGFLPIFCIAVYLVVLIGAYTGFEENIKVCLKENVGRNGWIYYISNVSAVSKNRISTGYQFTITYTSPYLGSDKEYVNSNSSYGNPYNYGDKALWRKAYGVGASFKVMDFNDANKPELAKKIEQYNTPILVIDHKDIHYNSVTKPSEYGINILYKAVVEQADSGRLCLSFRDIHNNEKSIMYTPAHQVRFMPDTFLLFNNEVSAPNFVVCAQQINTRENWAKVSDYGYIFGVDIYSKAEIEDKFEEVRKYVDNLRETGN